MFYNNIFEHLNMNEQSNYTDKRTGIVYTNIGSSTNSISSNAVTQPHLDVFIPPAFLKTYFGKD
jgi:hypothetical protein